MEDSCFTILPRITKRTSVRICGCTWMSNSQLKTVKEFLRLQHNFAAYHVAKTAGRLGILSALDSGQKTAEELAQQLGLHGDATEMLLFALCECGLAEHYGDLFALSPSARMFADKLTLEDAYWTRLDEFVRTGSAPRYSDVSPEGEQYPLETILLQRHAWMQTPAAMDAAEVLDIGRSRRGLRILELGGGHSIFSAALAHRDPDSRVTIIDEPIGLIGAKETVSSIGLENQFDFVEGDWRSAQVKIANFDLVVIAGRMHGLPPAECQRIIQTVVTSMLSPTGELVVVDVFRGQPEGSRTIAFFELELGLSDRPGPMHRPQSIRTWLQESGLSQVRYAHLPSPPHVWGLILAQRS